MKITMLIPLLLSALAVASPLVSPVVHTFDEPLNPVELAQALSNYRKNMVDSKASVQSTPPAEACVHLECECTGWE